MINFTIPVQFRQIAGGRDAIKIPGPTDNGHLSSVAVAPLSPDYTLRTVFDKIEETVPGFKARALDQEGKLRRFLLCYVDNVDARTKIDDQKKDYRIVGEPKDDDVLDLQLSGWEEITILPAIAGG